MNIYIFTKRPGSFCPAATFFLTMLLIGAAIIPARAQLTNITGVTSICPGNTTTLTGVGTGTFYWYADNHVTLLATGNSFTTPILNTNTAYWVEGSYGGFFSVNVNVASFPSYQATATPSTLCVGSSSTLTVPLSTQTVSWYDMPSGGNLIGTGALTVTPSATTVYYARFQAGVQQQTVTFNYTGGVQTFRVPAGVTSITVDARGARGGAAHEMSSYEGDGAPGPGLGGRLQAAVNVVPGQLLYIYVGQRGYGSGDCQPCSAHPAAFNGGGFVDNSNVNNLFGGGGGATDIRVGGQDLSNRLLVAGGGGGEGAQNGMSPSLNGGGGSGGGLVGGAGGLSGYANNGFPPYPIGSGGTQTAGGTNGRGLPTSGSLGIGGNGYSSAGGGGGGGGYYGGAGGAADCGGGGGSSYTAPFFCENLILTQGYQNGDGQLIITYNPAGGCIAPVILTDTVKVNPVVTAAVNITGAVTCPTCTPKTIAFTATEVNGGTTPVYAWYKNNTLVGTNSPTYTDNALSSGDNVFCKVTSSGPCLVANPVNSNVITVAQPVITSFSPSSGPAGTLVTIQGSNLQTLTAVNVGGVAAIPVSNNGSQVVAMVMPGATTGNVSITSLFGAVSGSGNFTFTAASPPGIQQGSKLTGGATPGNNLLYGSGVALSADGNTAIVGISGDNSGVGGALIYTRSNGTWAQQGTELIGAGASGNSAQGNAVSLSADGSTAMVGGNFDNSNAGAVWVYTRTNGTWSQQGNKLIGSNEVGGAQFGYAVSLSANGNTAFIGGLGDNNNLGAGWIFNRINGVWTQNGNKMVGTGAINTAEAYLGNSVAMSADGNTAVMGGKYDNARTGAIWVFTNNNGVWTQQGSKLLANDAISSPYGPELGYSVAVSADGNTIFSGGSRDNNFLGAAWVFTRSAGTWTQQGSKLVGTGIENPNNSSIYFGNAVSLSADGNTAIVGAPDDNNYTGAMWVFKRSNGTWAQQGNKITGAGEVPYLYLANFAQTIALSSDATTAIVGSQYDNSSAGAVWIYVPQVPPSLSSLAISNGTLSPAFSSTTTSYTASVGNGITSMTVTPTISDVNATVTVNGTTVTSGAASSAIPLVVGPNTITIIVTAQDGLTTKTYTLTVKRALSSNAKLALLQLSRGTTLSPVFAAATTSYTASVASTISSITVKPTAVYPTTTITVNGTAVISGTASSAIPLTVGNNIITLVGTAQDGVTKMTYTVTVTRISNNPKLALIHLSSGATLSPVFAAATTSYAASVANTTTAITVKPTAVYPTTTITVNGTTVASGSPSGAVALSVGVNTITLVCTAQDGITTMTYTVTVTRATGPVPIATPQNYVENVTNKLPNDSIVVHRGISPNGDGMNDFLNIEGIAAYPDNKLIIMNRSGELVFEAKGYDNSTRIFDGHSNKTGKMQQPGTYFYSFEYKVAGITKRKTGFLVLK